MRATGGALIDEIDPAKRGEAPLPTKPKPAGRRIDNRRYPFMQSSLRLSSWRVFARLAMTFMASAAMAAPGFADPTAANLNGTIPPGTKLRFHLSAPLGSDRNKAGDSFSFALLDPLMLDGQVLVAQGAIGTGTVIVSGHNGTLGHEGDLTLRLDSLQVSDAKTMRFADQRFEINGGNRKAESRILGLIPDAGIAALFMRGKEIHVDTTTPIQTVLLHPATVTENVPTPPASAGSPESASAVHRG